MICSSSDTRCLSKGNALQWFTDRSCRRSWHFSVVQSRKKTYFPLANGVFCCYMSDIFHHLNQHNIELQGRNMQSCSLWRDFMHFKGTLIFFSADVTPGKILHLSALLKSGLRITVRWCGIGTLKINFVTRLAGFRISTKVLRFGNLHWKQRCW